MEIFFYIIIFIIGILFGSFYTLAIYRIPRKQDITHTNSYCPNCHHKLGFLDLIPIFSYIFLFGKCRYCKEKIKPRYFFIELISGIIFVLMAYLINFTINNINIAKITNFSFWVLYITFIFLMSGIDLENRKMEKSVTIYGIVISIMYMIYLCIVEQTNIYRYIIYLILYIIILTFDTITLKRYAKSTYLNGILLSLITMIVFTNEYVVANSILITLIAVSIYLLTNKIKDNFRRSKISDKKVAQTISIGFYLGTSNTVALVMVLNCIKMLS